MSSDSINILCVSGSREKLQMAAMVASVAAVSGSRVCVFLSMNALPYFVRDAVGEPPAEGRVGALMTAKPVPSFKTLFEQAIELGAAVIHPCAMAMDVLEVREVDLDPLLGKPMGLTRFLADAAGGQIVSF